MILPDRNVAWSVSELTSREASLYATLMQLPLFVASMMGVADWFPPVSTVISNVPGPTEQLYWNGAPLLGSYPISAVFHGFALNITFVSYNGNLDFGIVACRHTVPQVQRLIDYLELPWEDQCLRFHEQREAVSTASAVQVREPVHTRSVGRWKRYEKQLEPMLAVLHASGLI